MELDVPFRETGDDGGKSGIQIMYLLKEFLPISYKKKYSPRQLSNVVESGS